MKPCSIVLCGVGGYGATYAIPLLDRENVHLAGYIDPRPEGLRHINRLNERCKRFESLEDFYAQGNQADLCVVSSPIPFHLPQSSLALRNGSHVLCEKPAASTPQDIREMDAVRRETGLYLDIGYQWSHSKAILRLKEIIASGKLGKAVRLRSMTLWPRNARYYNRSSWSGKVRDAKGNFILDSVMANATAHYLHNMFYVLGEKIDETACPESLQAELYRVNPIETFDTVMARAKMPGGAELLYLASHAVRDNVTLSEFTYEFENGSAIYPLSAENPIIEVRFNDGTKETLGDPFAQSIRKLDWMIGLATGQSAEKPPVPPLAALPLTLAVCAAHRSLPHANPFPEELIRLHNEDYTYIEGLQEIMRNCYTNWKLPSENGVAWAKAGSHAAITAGDVFSDPGIG